MINFSFRQKSNPQLFAFTSIVVVRLTDSRFASFKVQADSLATANAALNAALADSRATAADKEVRRKEVIALLDLLAVDIEAFAQGNETLEAAAGFETRKTTISKMTAINAPSNFSVLNTERTGEVRLSWKTVEGGLNYVIERRLKGETAWQNGNYTTKREILLPNFEPGTHMEFRVCALGRNELKSDWTSIMDVWVA